MMLSVIKEAVKQTIEVEKLTDFTVGSVLSVSPLKIEIRLVQNSEISIKSIFTQGKNFFYHYKYIENSQQLSYN